MAECRRAALKAARVMEEMDDVTDVGFRPEVHEEDSAVTMIEGAQFAAKTVAAGGR